MTNTIPYLNTQNTWDKMVLFYTIALSDINWSPKVSLTPKTIMKSWRILFVFDTEVNKGVSLYRLVAHSHVLISLYSSSFFLRLTPIESCKYVYHRYIYTKEWINDLQKFPFLNVTDEPPNYKYPFWILSSHLPFGQVLSRCISPLSTG